MEFNNIFLLLVAFVSVLVLVVFLPRAMKSQYSVNIDLKFLTCALHLDVQPNNAHENKLNQSSTSKLDKTIKK